MSEFGMRRSKLKGPSSFAKSIRPTPYPPPIIKSPEAKDLTNLNAAFLAKKYLLLGNGTNNHITKYYQRCVNIQTRKLVTCKAVPRIQEGLDLVVVYFLLSEDCDAINKVHEMVLSPTAFFLIMPASYGTVYNYAMEKKKLEELEAARIFRQMVVAVQFCHSKGVVLRDLKMANFVFRDKARTIVRLGTLESAVLLQDINNDEQSDKHGCPNYVSPEKAATLGKPNKKYAGRASDMWGLGIILYTLLVGRYPFSDGDMEKLMEKIKYGTCSIPQNLSCSAKCLIRGLLHKDPISRPSCEEVLQSSWIQKSCVEYSTQRDCSCNNMPPDFRTTDSRHVPQTGSRLSEINSVNLGEANRTFATPLNLALAINDTTMSELYQSNMDASMDQIVPNMESGVVA